MLWSSFLFYVLYTYQLVSNNLNYVYVTKHHKNRKVINKKNTISQGTGAISTDLIELERKSIKLDCTSTEGFFVFVRPYELLDLQYIKWNITTYFTVH